MLRTNPSAACLLLTAVAVGGCGDDDPSGLEPNPTVSSFELDVTGALSESAAGHAFFGADTDDNGNAVFGLVLGDDTTRHVIIAVKDGASRPGKGTYAVTSPDDDDPAWTLVHMVGEGEELVGMFVAESGSITVTESSNDVLEGTLEFDAEGLWGEGLGSISVEGSFVALRATDLGAMTAAQPHRDVARALELLRRPSR